MYKAQLHKFNYRHTKLQLTVTIIQYKENLREIYHIGVMYIVLPVLQYTVPTRDSQMPYLISLQQQSTLTHT